MTRGKTTKLRKKPNKKEPKNSPTTKLTEWHIENAYCMALLGLNDKEISAALGIAIDTFAKYKRMNDAFRLALQRGRVLADGKVAEALYHRAIGYSHPDTVISIYKGEVIETQVTKYYPPDTKAAYTFLRNRTRNNDEPWTDAKVLEITGKDGTPFHQLKPMEEIDISDLNVEELHVLKNMIPGLSTKADKLIKKKEDE